jgi:LacI family transcriptional regulator
VITLDEVARLANVSRGTVDRVIHGRGRVSKETAKRVKAIIKQVNYKPNILARSLSLARTFNFGVLLPYANQDGNYWLLPRHGVERARRDLEVYKVSVSYVEYDKYSLSSFNAACDEILENRGDFDGLLIAPVLSEAMAKFIKRIPANLPYVFFDSDLPNAQSLTYIGEDSRQSGVLAARLMRLSVHKSGTIATVRVVPRNDHIDERIQGFTKGLLGDERLKLKVYECDRQADPDIFSKIFSRIIEEQGEKLQGLFVPMATVAPFARALRGLGLSDDVSLIGYDLTEENAQCVRDGSIRFLICQRSEYQGYESVNSLFRHIVLNQPVETRKFVPLDIITRENIDYHME